MRQVQPDEVRLSLRIRKMRSRLFFFSPGCWQAITISAGLRSSSSAVWAPLPLFYGV
jgi:hypothetical protein